VSIRVIDTIINIIVTRVLSKEEDGHQSNDHETQLGAIF